MPEHPPAAPHLIVALDGLDTTGALQLADRLSPQQCRLKVGSELFVKGGPALIQELHTRGYAVFLDLKFHDIPNTVAAACRAARDLGVWMCTIHASGGRAMLEAAREAAWHEQAQQRTHIVAVTVLTSLQDDDLQEIGLPAAQSQVERLAQLAQQTHLSGIVCSPQEARQVRRLCGEDFWIVTPGIRPEGAATEDQKRTATPRGAIADGANYLVVGRPIVKAEDPLAAMQIILEEMA